MHDPISALFAHERATNLASSALPHAPVIRERRSRRRGALPRLRRRLV
jgi:hypothetical protein